MHTASYVMTFEGGDTVDAAGNPDEIEAFLTASRKLSPILKGHGFTFSYTREIPAVPANGCPPCRSSPVKASDSTSNAII